MATTTIGIKHRKPVKRTKSPAKGTIDLSPARNPDSVPAQLEALTVGDSYARGARIAMDDFAQESAREWFDKTTRVLSMQVARTKEANPRREYTIERTQGIANTAPYLLCAILVTRTA